MASLERRYGKFQGRKGQSYAFHEEEGGGVTWQCTFQPPHQRAMQTFDSTWANRTDYFQEAPGGTLWTIVWEPKGRGWSGVTQWLAFKLRHRRQVYSRIILPVVEHFQGAGTDAETTFY